MNLMLVVFVLMGIIYISSQHTHYFSDIQTRQNQQHVDNRDSVVTGGSVDNRDSVVAGGSVVTGGSVDNRDSVAGNESIIHERESIENNTTLNYLTQNCNIDINGDQVYFNNCGSAPIAQLQQILGNKSVYAITQKVNASEYNQHLPDHETTQLDRQYRQQHSLHSIATRGEPPKFRFMGNLISQSQPANKLFVQLYGRPTWTNSTKYDYYGVTKDAHGLTTKIPIVTKHNNFIEEHDIVDIEPLGQTFKLYPVGHPDAMRYNPYVI